MHDFNFDSIDVLAYILYRCNTNGFACGYTKAQKLLYCCYGVVLGLYGVRLTKEHPKCWQLGPVFPRAFNAHHKNHIKTETGYQLISQSPEWLKFAIDATIDNFGTWTAGQLVELTHQKDSAWYISSLAGTTLYNDVNDMLIASDFKKTVSLSKDDPRPNGL